MQLLFCFGWFCHGTAYVSTIQLDENDKYDSHMNLNVQNLWLEDFKGIF